MSDEFKDQIAQEIARIEALPQEEQAEAYRALHSTLENVLEQAEGK
jgi:hypothetical protein